MKIDKNKLYNIYANVSLACIGLSTAVVSAEVDTGKGIFSVISNAVLLVTGIIKWAALLYILIKILVLGYDILVNAKNSSDAFKKVKDEGLALIIGFFIIIAAVTIQGSIETVAKQFAGVS